MAEAGLGAVVIGATASLRYFTGMSWHPSERSTGAIVHAAGGVDYICPGFERDKVSQIVGIPGDIHTWEEDESPWRLIAGLAKGRVALDDQVALFVYLGLRQVLGEERLGDAGPLINRLRRCKSPGEIA